MRGVLIVASNSTRGAMRRVSRFAHGAALTLMGWYLMVPPLPKPSAPVSHWKILKFLESEAECEAHRKKMLREVDDDQSGEAAVITFETPQGEKQFVARAASCFDAKDPRLHHRSLLHRRAQNSTN